jgi:hypothetical protein
MSYMSVMTWKINFIKCTCRCKGMLKSQMILFPNFTYLASELTSNYMTCWLDLPHTCWNWAERFDKMPVFLSLYICHVVHVVTAYESIPSGIDEGSHIWIKNLIKCLHMRSPFFWDWHYVTGWSVPSVLRQCSGHPTLANWDLYAVSKQWAPLSSDVVLYQKNGYLNCCAAKS